MMRLSTSASRWPNFGFRPSPQVRTVQVLFAKAKLQWGSCATRAAESLELALFANHFSHLAPQSSRLSPTPSSLSLSYTIQLLRFLSPIHSCSNRRHPESARGLSGSARSGPMPLSSTNRLVLARLPSALCVCSDRPRQSGWLGTRDFTICQYQRFGCLCSSVLLFYCFAFASAAAPPRRLAAAL